MLVSKTKKYLFTDFRYIERAKNTITKNIEIIETTKMWKNKELLKQNWTKILKKHKIKVLGIEESDLTVTQMKKFKKISKGIKFTNISGEIEQKREIKSTKEIGLITKSQKINEKVFLEIKKIINTTLNQKSNKLPLTEIYLAWKIKEFGFLFGADDVSFEPMVSFEKHSAMPHHSPDKTKLKKGNIILIDMGMKYKGYCSDMTRMIFTAHPTEKQRKIYNIVLQAQETAIKKIKAGVTGKTADNFSRKIIEKHGFGENYGHAGGHGVGLDIHESPSLSENHKKPLKENSIITVEPGIYIPGEFGIRIEDMILVTKTGNKNLTKIKK